MPYVQTETWKQVVKDLSDENLDAWIAAAKRNLPVLKELVSHGDPHNAIIAATAIMESDLALYKEEKQRRLEKKR